MEPFRPAPFTAEVPGTLTWYLEVELKTLPSVDWSETIGATRVVHLCSHIGFPDSPGFSAVFRGNQNIVLTDFTGVT